MKRTAELFVSLSTNRNGWLASNSGSGVSLIFRHMNTPATEKHGMYVPHLYIP
jgi:hypothetical protein